MLERAAETDVVSRWAALAMGSMRRVAAKKMYCGQTMAEGGSEEALTSASKSPSSPRVGEDEVEGCCEH